MAEPDAIFAAPATIMDHEAGVEDPDTSSVLGDVTRSTTPTIRTNAPTQTSRVPKDFADMTAR